MFGTHFYNVFQSIKERCRNKKCRSWGRYGGRGIACMWESIMDFKEDMYASYIIHIGKHGRKNTTIERIDNDGDYSKSNCRWATKAEQNRNYSRNIKITIEGKTMVAKDWAIKYNVPYKIFWQRITRDKMEPKFALTKPLKRWY